MIPVFLGRKQGLCVYSMQKECVLCIRCCHGFQPSIPITRLLRSIITVSRHTPFSMAIFSRVPTIRKPHLWCALMLAVLFVNIWEKQRPDAVCLRRLDHALQKLRPDPPSCVVRVNIHADFRDAGIRLARRDRQKRDPSGHDPRLQYTRALNAYGVFHPTLPKPAQPSRMSHYPS